MILKILFIFWATLGFANEKIPYVSWALIEKQASMTNGPVQIPGYMVPLGKPTDKVTQFVLLPHLPTCLESPPPTAAQSIVVKVKDSATAKFTSGLVLVTGRLKKNPTKVDRFGDVGFVMDEGEYVSVEKAKAASLQKYLPHVGHHH